MAQVRHVERLVTVVIVIILSFARRPLSGPGQAPWHEADATPARHHRRAGLGRLSMPLIGATCEDRVVHQYQPARIRVRDEERSRNFWRRTLGGTVGGGRRPPASSNGANAAPPRRQLGQRVHWTTGARFLPVDGRSSVLSTDRGWMVWTREMIHPNGGMPIVFGLMEADDASSGRPPTFRWARFRLCRSG